MRFFLSARTIFRFWPLSPIIFLSSAIHTIHPKQYDTDYNKASIYYSLRFRFTLPDTKNQPEDPENICHKHHTASPDHGRENEHGIYNARPRSDLMNFRIFSAIYTSPSGNTCSASCIVMNTGSSVQLPFLRF